MANAHLQAETAALSEEHAGHINFITTNPKLPRYAEWKIFVNIVSVHAVFSYTLAATHVMLDNTRFRLCRS